MKTFRSLFFVSLLTVYAFCQPVAARAEHPPLPVNCAEDQFFFSDGVTLASLGHLIFKWTGAGWERLPALTDWDQLRVAGGTIYLYSNQTNTIHSSADGGQTWSSLDVTVFPAAWHEDLYPSPAPGVLFLYVDAGSVSDGWGIWKSTDAGETWHRVYQPAGALSWYGPLVFSPGFAQDGTAFVAWGGRGVFSGILKSIDGGATWDEVNDGLSVPAQITPGVRLAVSPQYPQDGTVFGGRGADNHGFYKTVNGGALWTLITWDALATPALSPDYAEDQTLLMAWPSLYVSDDGGQTRQQVWDRAGEYPKVVGLRHEGAAPDPSGPLEFWTVAQRGPTGAACYLYRSTDGGETWELQQLFETPHEAYLPVVAH